MRTSSRRTRSGVRAVSRVRVGGVCDKICRVPYAVGRLPLGFFFSAKTDAIAVSSIRTGFVLGGNCLGSSSVGNGRCCDMTANRVRRNAAVHLHRVGVNSTVLHGISTSIIRGRRTPLLLNRAILRHFKAMAVSGVGSGLVVGRGWGGKRR